MDDLISRQAAIDAVRSYYDEQYALCDSIEELIEKLPSADTDLSDYSDRLWKNAYERGKAEGAKIPSAQPERLTDDDFETIRIHLNAHKEELCNQGRWEEAEEYQRILDRFMAFASAEPERKKGKWKRRLVDDGFNADWHCSKCGWKTSIEEHGYKYCPNCGAWME